MNRPLCSHQLGPVHVEHGAGSVVARCVTCSALLSAWLGEDGEPEAIELRGVVNDVKHHLYRLHGMDDCSGCETLRRCAWDSMSRALS